MSNRGTISRALNLVGLAVLLWFLVQQLLRQAEPWLWVASLVACAAWLLRQLLPDRGPLPLTLTFVALAASSLAAMPTSILGYVPGLICLAAVVADPARSLWLGPVAAAGSVAIVAVVALIVSPPLPVLLGGFAALILATLTGVSRRQSRRAAAVQQDLLEERVRAGIARDLHDVLAHSLGGLVVQLDAVEAQLEAGHTESALERTRSARALAAEGLDEARNAVAALREPGATDLADAVAALVETSRLLGATVDLHQTGTAGPVPPLAATALRRAAQELLTNARKHAPGAHVGVSLDWRPDAVVLTVRTPRSEPGELGRSGGGRGLAGIRERFAEVRGGRVEVDDGDPFTVRVEASR